MTAIDLLRTVLLVTHFMGLAAIIGSYIFQLRVRTGLVFQPLLVGAIVQLASGVALIAFAKLTGADTHDLKLLVKFVIAVGVLGCAITGALRRRRDAGDSWQRTGRSLLHSAGILAILNVVVAVAWA